MTVRPPQRRAQGGGARNRIRSNPNRIPEGACPDVVDVLGLGAVEPQLAIRECHLMGVSWGLRVLVVMGGICE